MPHKLTSWRAQLPCASGHKRNLSAYMDGELERGLRAGMEKHLARCPRCRAQYEQLRFASRAMSQVVVPQARPPAWQAVAATRPARQSETRARLERFWTMKLSIPAPVAAVLALLFCLAGVLSLGQLNRSPLGVEPAQTNALVPQIRFIEVPVERERIVTRTIYAARESRQTGTAQPATPTMVANAANKERRATLIAVGAEREQRTLGSNTESLTSTSLAGFRPATDANLRIVKEPEQ
jgi:hypothetical protein